MAINFTEAIDQIIIEDNKLLTNKILTKSIISHFTNSFSEGAMKGTEFNFPIAALEGNLYACCTDGDSTVTIDAINFEVTCLRLSLKFCLSDLSRLMQTRYAGMKLLMTSTDDKVTPELRQVLQELVIDAFVNAINDIFINGDTESTGTNSNIKLYDGLIKQSGVTAKEITEGSVWKAINDIITETRVKATGRKLGRIFVMLGTDLFSKYLQALGNFNPIAASKVSFGADANYMPIIHSIFGDVVLIPVDALNATNRLIALPELAIGIAVSSMEDFETAIMERIPGGNNLVIWEEGNFGFGVLDKSIVIYHLSDDVAGNPYCLTLCNA